MTAQSEQQKIRSRLRSYERKLRLEKKKYGDYDDSAGKRYQIAPHYMLLGDNDGALAAFAWFEQEFDDDGGKPDHLLCWSLALHRASNQVGAARKLRQAMLSNLYLVPYLIDAPISRLDIWHGSSDAEPNYVESIPEQYLQLWTDEERNWAAGLYQGPGFQLARDRCIEIRKLLDSTRPGTERHSLLSENDPSAHAARTFFVSVIEIPGVR